MRAAWACPAIAAWLALFCGPASATESDGQLWATGRINHPIGARFTVSFLAQGRFADDISEPDAWLVRPAVGYRLRDSVWLGAGYDYFRLVDRSCENRFWQEVALPVRLRDLVTGHRLRIEQRWVDGKSGTVARARYRLWFAHPIASTPARISELRVDAGEWLGGKTLAEAGLSKEGILVLGIECPGGNFIGAPAEDTEMRERDRLLLYGRTSQIAEIGRRASDSNGQQSHLAAVAEQERIAHAERRAARR